MSRNPFGVEDVPEPDGDDVAAFATTVRLRGIRQRPERHELGRRPRRGDPVDQLTPVKPVEDRGTALAGRSRQPSARRGPNPHLHRVRRDEGAKHGLVEARCEGERLVGRYLNLDATEITRPWVGLVVDATRIDGEIPGGRIDFRRSASDANEPPLRLVTSRRYT